MNTLLIDLILSGITYVILTYLTFKLMHNKKKGDDEGGGELNESRGPTIDLPPGISWPSEDHSPARQPESVLY